MLAARPLRRKSRLPGEIGGIRVIANRVQRLSVRSRFETNTLRCRSGRIANGGRAVIACRLQRSSLWASGPTVALAVMHERHEDGRKVVSSNGTVRERPLAESEVVRLVDLIHVRASYLGQQKWSPQRQRHETCYAFLRHPCSLAMSSATVIVTCTFMTEIYPPYM
ncbi:MAG: hypothetical protein Q9218_004724 [Villophora microphyllina]